MRGSARHSYRGLRGFRRRIPQCACGSGKPASVTTSSKPAQPQPELAIDDAAQLAQSIKEAMAAGQATAAPAQPDSAPAGLQGALWATTEETDDQAEDAAPELPEATQEAYDDNSVFFSDGWEVTVGDDEHLLLGSDDEDDGGLEDAQTYRSQRQPVTANDRGSAAIGDEGVQSLLRPHLARQLGEQQLEVFQHAEALRPAELKKRKKTGKRNSYLRIIAGSAAGSRLFSPSGMQIRPMMEKVRGALFSMLLAQSSTGNRFPPGMRWLDLFAGTGAIGLEGLSRGCQEAHFVELDPWVTENCLSPNIHSTGFRGSSFTHMAKVEDYLRRVATHGQGSPFDFVSVTPPYLEVSYSELFDLMTDSPLLHPKSIVIVEYAKQNIPEIRDSIGQLKRVRDRRYGRTNVAVYASES